MKQYFTINHWVDILRKLSQEQRGGLLPLTVLSRLSGLKNYALRKALLRAEEKGLVERVYSGLYLNKFATVTVEEIAMLINRPCYISFESALTIYGIISQEPFVLTCATTRKPANKSTSVGDIVYRHITAKKFWGFNEKKGILIAEPEKAFLDLLYWSGKTRGRFPDLDEMNLMELKKEKVFSYAEKFPLNLQKYLKKNNLME
ncbi:MAG: hypothetical protein AUJ85_04680 [Elusimicrobia bacterium CG1_02_37_114]|nr:MAG: hypothetical protein AUJ85_04680 [Elusimicrobia bacterium CG1_02_37_114]PIZ12984.1 MAG: hypothetical protein COY53_07185 [Elusimicrobia bacterium CG_4_10_14_0_8_um_filter_37_32]